MKFNDKFILDEVRDGFYISGLMKRNWGAQIAILNDISSLCEMNNIRWFADWGTLLGAVRHNGYIPWDDDIDICMLRSDFNKFSDVARKELPSNYIVRDYIHGDFKHELIRVNNTLQIELGKEHLDKYCGFPFPAGLDIFCIDNICDEDSVERSRSIIAKKVMDLATLIRDRKIDVDETEDFILLIEDIVKCHIDRKKDLFKQLYIIGDKLYQLFDGEKTKYVTCMNYWLIKGMKFQSESFSSTVKLQFEGININAPIGYDNILSEEFGDYWIKVRKGGDHNYPLYSEIEDWYIDYLGGTYPYKYIFNDNDLKRYSVAISRQEEKKNIVILTSRAMHWENIEQLYLMYKKNGKYDVKVVVVPYYIKNFNGDIISECYEGAEYPKNVDVIDYKEIDLEQMRPEVLLTQMGHDCYEYCSEVDSKYYTSNLKKYTSNLIYVCPFVTDEYTCDDYKMYKSMEHYVYIPGVANCDYTLVQSEHMRSVYIDYWIKQTGEKYREIWNDKIISDIGSLLL